MGVFTPTFYNFYGSAKARNPESGNGNGNGIRNTESNINVEN